MQRHLRVLTILAAVLMMLANDAGSPTAAQIPPQPQTPPQAPPAVDWQKQFFDLRQARANASKKYPLLCHARAINVHRVDLEGDFEQLLVPSEVNDFLADRLRTELPDLPLISEQVKPESLQAVERASFVCRVWLVGQRNFASHINCRFWGREFTDVDASDLFNEIEMETLSLTPRDEVEQDVADGIDGLVLRIADTYKERRSRFCGILPPPLKN